MAFTPGTLLEKRTRRGAFAALVFVLSPWPVLAQAPRDGRLLVTVVDQTGSVLPDAKVSVVGLDAAAKKDLDPVRTSEQGVATIVGLPPGRYTITAEFPGFNAGVLPEVRVRAGDNRQTITLALQGLKDSVTVDRDRQQTAADRRNTFGGALTREQIDALSDDPDEMATQLQAIAGGAVIRVDGFEDGRLPPKSMIKSIHIARDAFAAENHSAGGLFIDIVTQPGIGPIRGGGRYTLRDGALSSRNPFTPVKGDERRQNVGANVAGTLIKDRASFNVSVDGSTSYDTPSLFVALPSGTRSEALPLRAPRTNAFVYANVDYAVSGRRSRRSTKPTSWQPHLTRPQYRPF